MRNTAPPVIGSPLNLSHPLSVGLVGCWPMNDNLGNTLTDYGSLRNHGTIQGAVWGPGANGPCLSFLNASSRDVLFPTFTSDALFANRTFTVSFWIKVPSSPTGTIISKGGRATATYEGGWIILTETTRIVNIIYKSKSTGGNNYIGTPVGLALPAGVWTHVVCVCTTSTTSSSSNSARMWWDGVEKPLNQSKTSVYNTDTIPLRLGSRSNGGTTYLTGDVRGLCIYNRGLTVPEIQMLYSDPNGMFRRSPIMSMAGALATSINVTVSPSALSLLLGLQGPTTQYDFVQTVAALGLNVTLSVPSVNYDFTHSPSTLPLTVTLGEPVINYDFTHSPAALPLNASLLAPATTFDFVYTPDALSAVLSLPAPTPTYDYVVALDAALSLALALQSPDVTSAVSVTVEPGSLNLVLSLASPTFAFDYLFAASPQALGLSLPSPTLNFDYLHAVASALGMTLTVVAPTVVLSAGRTYIVCSSMDPVQLDVYVQGTLVARFT